MKILYITLLGFKTMPNRWHGQLVNATICMIKTLLGLVLGKGFYYCSVNLATIEQWVLIPATFPKRP